MVKNQNLEELVKEKGWQRKPIGYYRSSGQTKEIEGYYLYVRKTLFDDFLKKSSQTVDKAPSQEGAFLVS